MAAPRIVIGSRVNVTNGEGVVRWLGTNPEFAAGSWVGVELNEPTGKNDGSVKGKSYFECQPFYGVFVRPGSIKVIDGSEQLASSSSRPQSSLSQAGILSGAVSPARRPSSSQTFSPSRPSSTTSNVPPNPLQQKLSRAAAGLSASSSARDLAGLAGTSRRTNTRPAPTERRAASPTPSPSSTPTPAPRPIFTSRGSRPPSTLSQTTAAGLPRPSAISTGQAPNRPTSSASTHSRSSRPSSVASHTQLENIRPSSRSSTLEQDLHGRSSAASVRTVDDAEPIEELQATPKAAIEPRRFGRGLAQNLVATRPSSTYEPGESSREAVGSGQHPADVFRAARTLRAATSAADPLKHGTHQSGTTLEVPDAPGADREGSRVFIRELEEMRAKIRKHESKRAEDADRIKALEARALETEGLAQNTQKLKARFLEIQQDLSTQRKLYKALEKERDEFIAQREAEGDLREAIEATLLDKDIADERINELEGQVSDLTTRLEEVELEKDIFKEENAKNEKPVEPGQERSSVAFIQLERQNERLREGLMRLRDVSSDTEKMLKSRIVELEKETNGSEGLRDELDKARHEIEKAESQIEELKQQLDVALSAEDMLEQLTERTLNMGEKIEEMRIHIEDLEAIKEMNDEMEEGHIETERHLQETIDALAADLREQKDREGELETLVADREGTILQFRDLVQGLQGELNDLRAKHHETEAETANLSSQSQAMLNMNLKLQNSASKTQARALDLALAKIEAKVAKEQTEIIQAYLPASYYGSDSEATNAVLLVHRLAGKADILVSTFCQMHNLPDALIDVNNDRLPGVCEVRGLITVFANFLARLAGSMMRGPPQEFLALARLNMEFAPIEEKVDHWFTLIRKNEFSERDCSLELAGYVGQLERALGSITSGVELDVAERQLGLALAFDYELDNFAASVGLARYGILEMVKDADALVEDPVTTIEQEIFEPVQRILNQVRAVKLNSIKLVDLVRRVSDQSTALEHDLHTPLRMISESVSRATDVAVQLAQKIGGHLNDLRGSQEPLRLSVILQFLQEVTSAINPEGDIKPWDIIGMFVTRLGTDLNSLLPRIQTAVEEGNLIQTGFAGPWVLRADTLRADLASNAEAETRVASQAEQITSLLREVKTRDQMLEETQVKVELMERRLEISKKNAEDLHELEVELREATERASGARNQVQALESELSKLATENAQLRQLTASDAAAEGARSRRAGGTANGLNEQHASHLAAEVANLKAAIDIVRRENTLLKAEGLLGEVRSLPALSHAMDPVPALDLNEVTGGASSDSDAAPKTPRASIFKRPTTVQKNHLWVGLATAQASASVIDLTQVKPGRGWQPLRRLPEVQWSEKLRAEEKMVKSLKAFVE